MNYQEIAYKLGLMSELIDDIMEMFTPEQDEALADMIVDIHRNVTSAESHCLVAVDLEEMTK